MLWLGLVGCCAGVGLGLVYDVCGGWWARFLTVRHKVDCWFWWCV